MRDLATVSVDTAPLSRSVATTYLVSRRLLKINDEILAVISIDNATHTITVDADDSVQLPPPTIAGRHYFATDQNRDHPHQPDLDRQRPKGSASENLVTKFWGCRHYSSNVTISGADTNVTVW